MGEPLLRCAKAQLKMGGDLVQVVDVEVTLETGAEIKHTLRKNGAAILFKGKAIAYTFNALIDETGPERKWFSIAHDEEIRTFQLVAPLLTVVILGGLGSVKMSSKWDDATMMALGGVGVMVR